MKNIGIIGCGKIAQTRHIPEYMDNQDSRLAAFYDVNAERARFLAKKYGGVPMARTGSFYRIRRLTLFPYACPMSFTPKFPLRR